MTLLSLATTWLLACPCSQVWQWAFGAQVWQEVDRGLRLVNGDLEVVTIFSPEHREMGVLPFWCVGLSEPVLGVDSQAAVLGASFMNFIAFTPEPTVGSFRT